jgi:hypothetical protein
MKKIPAMMIAVVMIAVSAWAQNAKRPEGNDSYVNKAGVAKAAAGLKADLSASGAVAGHVPVFTDTSGDLGNSLIFQSVSASGKFVGIGTSAPAEALEVSGANPTLRIDNYSNTAGDSPNFNFISSRGTSTTPLATQLSDNLGQFAAAGYNGSAFPGSKVKVNFIATENWTTGANGTAMTFATTKNFPTQIDWAQEHRRDARGLAKLDRARHLQQFDSPVRVFALQGDGGSNGG